MDVKTGSRSLLLILIIGVLASFSASAQQMLASTSPAEAQPTPAVPLLPRCSEIAGQGDHFGLLGTACQYALSPESLPNFICEETVHRWTNGHKLDIVTTEVTVIHGHDRYSNYTRDGKPIPNLQNTGGWVSNALFGSELNAIFRSNTKSAFTFKRETGSHGSRAAEFNYQFERSGTPHFDLAGSYPEMAGVITIDEKTGQLRRVETTATKVDPNRPLKSYKTVMDYGELPVEGLGKLLLPVSGKVKVCLRGGDCFRNELSFHDCRKFGSEATILPSVEPEP